MKLKLMYAAVLAAFASHVQGIGLAPGAVEFELAKDAWSKLPKDVQALYVEKDGKYRLDGVEVEDVSGLKSALTKERDLRKEEERKRKEFEKKWEGLDPVEMRALVDKLGGDEEAQLIKAGKIDEVVTRRTEKQRLAHEKALAAAADATKKATERAEKFAQRVLDNHVRAAATKSGMHANAVDDALFRARVMFTLNEEGEAVQLKDGEVVMGKDGKTPFAPTEWLEGMKTDAPHWFPSGNNGGGAGGNTTNKGGAKTILRTAFEALDPIARQKTMKEGVVVVDA